MEKQKLTLNEVRELILLAYDKSQSSKISFFLTLNKIVDSMDENKTTEYKNRIKKNTI